MRFSEGFKKVVDAVTGSGNRKSSGEVAVTPRPETTPTPQPHPPTERRGPINHRNKHRAEQRAGTGKEVLSPPDKRGHEELYATAGTILDEIDALKGQVPENAQLHLDSYRNEFNSIFRSQYDNACHDTESIKTNTEKIKTIQKSKQDQMDTLSRLRGPDRTEENQKQTKEILSLAEDAGIHLSSETGIAMTDAEKLENIQKIHQVQLATKKPSYKTNILLIKYSKQLEEGPALAKATGDIEKRIQTYDQEIAQLTKANQDINSRIAYLRQSMADFVSEVEKVRNKAQSAITQPAEKMAA